MQKVTVASKITTEIQRPQGHEEATVGDTVKSLLMRALYLYQEAVYPVTNV